MAIMDFMRNEPPRSFNDDRDVVGLIRSWPAELPLAMLSSARRGNAWSRWSMLCSPAGRLRIDSGTGRVHWNGGVEPPCAIPETTDDPLALVQQLLDSTSETDGHGDTPPFNGGWLTAMAYELGRVIEPGAGRNTEKPPSDWPLLDLLWCPSGLVLDHDHDRWWSFGGCEMPPPTATRDEADMTCSEPVSTPDEHTYTRDVQRVRDYIHEGDVFQVNLARRLRSRIDVDPRLLAARAMHTAGPTYGLYVELPGEGDVADRAILSLSPELFLQVDAAGESRRVVTRPIKGTRPADRDPAELEASAKDAAELHMIVDLMRNDLGRVCELGSVQVVHRRHIETHPTVHHGVGEVHGTLLATATVTDLLRATFPPGSITGAPKIRAMQIIDELETEPRGPYCGGLGWLTRDRARLSVGIRTMAMTGDFRNGFTGFEGEVVYGTGGGIVSDSCPLEEYRETCHKAVVFESTLGLAKTPLG
ncbi:MAG: aminodeoxychorismate synthase component I [Phycisphaerae bacterium]|nr:aminodeoxychorismate synthase component I [Phycisphaerae bacterium]